MSTKEDKESKEPDYDEDENQLEEKQEKETREQETTNQIFWIVIRAITHYHIISKYSIVYLKSRCIHIFSCNKAYRLWD